MEEIEKQKNSSTEAESSPPGRFPGVGLGMFGSKKMVLVAVILVVFTCFFIPFKGKSLLDRLLELRKEEVENLLPNPGFEEGSGEEPAGWEAKSGRVE